MKAKPVASPAVVAATEKRLEGFIDKFAPANQALIREVRGVLRSRLPAAHEMVYDNYNFFVIGYSPTERPSDAIFSIAASAKGVSLCFLQGAKLADPEGLLRGEGKQTRFMPIESAAELARPDVESLIETALQAAKTPLSPTGKGILIIKSVSAKQRPRQKL